MSRRHWTAANRIELLCGGEAFFPRVFDAIRAAEREVVIETFIVFEDKVGNELHAVLADAARRGVAIDLLLDGFGCADLSATWIGSLTELGVRIRIFDPGRRLFGQRLNIFRRMHRKITVVDGRIGFIGGINFSADHLIDFGPMAKLDYSAEVEGPIVTDLHRFVLRAIALSDRRTEGIHQRLRQAASAVRPVAGDADLRLTTRDNRRHGDDIEHHYRRGIRAARERIFIANAYFFPGYRFIRTLRGAAKRGVDVRLILQGEPDMPIVKSVASMLYHHLLRAGVRIFEYRKTPLHAKVGLVDDDWATIGSSNLDPLSLSLNLEANLLVRSRAFNLEMREELERVMRDSCHEVMIDDLDEWSVWRLVRSYFVFHFMRWYPRIGHWLPRQAAHVQSAHNMRGYVRSHRADDARGASQTEAA